MHLRYCRASSFADDTRIVALENSKSQAVIQEELAEVYRWAAVNLMSFNISKFEHLQYRVHHQLAPLQHCGWKTNKKNGKVKDLGIVMDSNAHFDLHIQTRISKARKQAGWVLRSFQSRDQVSMSTLYKATILPILEYCSQLWNPSKLGLIRDIESVQRYFTSRIADVSHLHYWDRLKSLQMYSLEKRRERYLILYIYRIILGVTPNFEDERSK